MGRGTHIALAALTLAACRDATLGLDDGRLTLSRVLVPGACAVSGDLSRVELAFLIPDEDTALLPDDRIPGETGCVADLLAASDFRFVENPVGADPGELEGKQGLAENDGEREGQRRVRLAVGLEPEAVRFHWTGGEARRDDDRLVVLLMDQSGSVAGEDPRTGAIDWSRASDRFDARHFFARDLVAALPEDDAVALMAFQRTTAELAAGPTRDRDAMAEAIDALHFRHAPEGGTPLALALDRALSQVVHGNADLNPVVVLFTDGVEAGDTSPGGLTLEAVADRYARDAVPVIVVHLQAPEGAAALGWPRGHDPALADLACRTGGEYVFVRDAETFSTHGDLPTIVRERLVGTWRLRVRTGLAAPELPPGRYVLTSELSVTLGGNTMSAPMALARDVTGATWDSRLWFEKR